VNQEERLKNNRGRRLDKVSSTHRSLPSTSPGFIHIG
jgi:hypothetical protein